MSAKSKIFCNFFENGLSTLSVVSLAGADLTVYGNAIFQLTALCICSYNFEKEFADLVPSIVSATADVYSSAAKNLLPTPAKSHYLFNLRDYSRIIGGVCLCTPQSAVDVNSLKKLWVHEVGAVYVFLIKINDSTQQLQPCATMCNHVHHVHHV